MTEVGGNAEPIVAATSPDYTRLTTAEYRDQMPQSKWGAHCNSIGPLQGADGKTFRVYVAKVR